MTPNGWPSSLGSIPPGTAATRRGDRAPPPRLVQRAEEPLELGRVRRRRAVLVRPAPPTDADLDRADEPGRQPGGGEHGGHEEGARRLPVGAAHPDQAG